MDFSILKDILITLAGVIGLGLLFFYYFKNEKVRKSVDAVLKNLPFILSIVQRFIKDKPGQFDTYDALELMSRVSVKIKETLADDTNKKFEDVKDEVFDIVRFELAQYGNLPGVPDLDDPAIQVQVEVVFQSIQRALIEDRTSSDS